MLRQTADHQMPAPPFQVPLHFPDVEPEILAREEVVFVAPWNDYLRKFLPPMLPS